MAKGNASTSDILNVPQPSRERGQRSMLVSDAYFARMIPGWSQPSTLSSAQWRAWVAAQPVAVTCKETLVSNIADLDWKITPRESDMRDELKGLIKHYEKFFRRAGDSGLDWIGFLEWFINDLNDLPFGTAWEVGRKGDSPDGRAIWMEPIDGGTLYPTNNKDFPVFQYYNGYDATFPAHAVARAYLNPRPEIERKGWGIAPPEKIFMAMEMLARGDRYYAQLLLDIPPAGIFDLGDITWEDANTWIESFRTFTQGGSMESFKIPVLAEHTGEVKFIPLGKDPNAIMYDIITLKYAALVVAGYGMSLGDIGLQGSSASGETLAGSIRGEQKTNRTGKARNKGKIKYFIESILPPSLQFDFIDTDGERLSMLGRARLANATAMNQFREMEAISPEEGRLQMIQDGIFTISMPEKPPAEAKKPVEPVMGAFGKKPAERPGQVGAPQAPSLGGDGEVKKSLISFKPSNLDWTIESVVSIIAPNVYETLSVDDSQAMKSAVLESVFSGESFAPILSGIVGRVGTFDFSDLSGYFEEDLDIESLKTRIQEGFPEFLGKAIVYNLAQSELLLSPKDSDGVADFSELIKEVKSRITKSLPEYISAHVEIEVENAIREEEARIEKAVEELPDPIRMRSISRQQQPISVVVNPPNITMPSINITSPMQEKRDEEMQVIINNTQPEQVAIMKAVTEKLEQLSGVVEKDSIPPTIQVNVSPTPVEISNEVNVETTPVAVTVSPTPVEINYEVTVEPTPVNVNVEPTPLEVNVNIPEQKPMKREITIVKDSENTWHGEASSEEEA